MESPAPAQAGLFFAPVRCGGILTSSFLAQAPDALILGPARSRLELAAEIVVDGIAPAPPEADRGAEQQPHQRELDAFLRPEIAELPLIEDNDHRHLDPDRDGAETREETDGESGRAEGFGEYD